MTAFVTDGPDIPEELLQAQEEGRVVFFCGAGISYPAKLPGFRGLVEKVYSELGTDFQDIERVAFDSGQYDSTLNQLERRYPGRRLAVRTAMAKVLTPGRLTRKSTTTHQALLGLATDREKRTRIVTTNFDRIFERVIKREKLGISHFCAPLLPIPKASRWSGIVYLHGLLPKDIDETELNRLVLTSGDFGLAYLTERWASRFVSELFRNYTVCFVGYGINDPVLRYMMDALAADELLGEKRTVAYAFASFESGQQHQSLLEWETKGVVPLLYEVPVGTHDHSLLHRTIAEWGSTYRDGVRGKEMIIAQHATSPPVGPSRSDFATGRVLWALTDGLAAKHFADLNPVPPLKWLDPLSEDQFTQVDLPRFGVTPNQTFDEKLRFSVIRRPSPYTHSRWMRIEGTDGRSGRWDEPMYHIARWLLRHLDDPELVIWLAKRGGPLHYDLLRMVRMQLKKLDKLRGDGEQAELDRILQSAPNAVPRPIMRSLWRVLLAGRLKCSADHFDLYDWARRAKTEGVTPSLRIELRQILTPCLRFRAPFKWHEVDEYEPAAAARVKDLVDWELELASDHVHSVLADISKLPEWPRILPQLLHDAVLLLRDAVELMAELGGVEERSDLSYIHRPSISDHAQNNDFNDWTALITLVRDAWLATAGVDVDRARAIAEEWWRISYPLFKRFAYFAAAHADVVPNSMAIEWLTGTNRWWLWSVETQREAIRLLVALAPRLDAAELHRVTSEILVGPPREMFRDELEEEEWERIKVRSIWERLAKLESVVELDSGSMNQLSEIRRQQPEWKLSEDEADEFPFRIGTGDEWSHFTKTPRQMSELVEWLIENPGSLYGDDDDWQERCRDELPIAIRALRTLASRGAWPAHRWREGMQVWVDERMHRGWRFAGPVLVKAPDEFIRDAAYGLGSWLHTIAKSFEGNEEDFLELCGRILSVEFEEDDNAGDPVTQAINHPIGHVTWALLDWWSRRRLEDHQLLPVEIRRPFTGICDSSVRRFRHGRVLLATHVLMLFRVDPEWTEQNLLPLFDWERDETEATAAWRGFLWSPRLYRPLLTPLKRPLLDAAGQYEKLGDHARQYTAFLTFVALDAGDSFAAEELSGAFGRLPPSGLASSANALERALVGAGNQREEYWQNRIVPFIIGVWPKTLDRRTRAVSQALAQVCVVTDASFPRAVEMLQHWLQPLEHPDFIIHRLQEARLDEQFPHEALTFVDRIIGEDLQWLPRELGQCLDRICEASPMLAEDPRHVRLREVVRRLGG